MCWRFSTALGFPSPSSMKEKKNNSSFSLPCSSWSQPTQTTHTWGTGKSQPSLVIKLQQGNTTWKWENHAQKKKRGGKSSKLNTHNSSSNSFEVRKWELIKQHRDSSPPCTSLQKSLFTHNWECGNPQKWSVCANTRGVLQVRLTFSNFSYSVTNKSNVVQPIIKLLPINKKYSFLTFPLATRGKSFHIQRTQLNSVTFSEAMFVGTEEDLPWPCVQTQQKQHGRDTMC